MSVYYVNRTDTLDSERMICKDKNLYFCPTETNRQPINV